MHPEMTTWDWATRFTAPQDSPLATSGISSVSLHGTCGAHADANTNKKYGVAAVRTSQRAPSTYVYGALAPLYRTHM